MPATQGHHEPLHGKAPLPVVRRLSLYYSIIIAMKESHITHVSSTHLAQALGYKPVQVRKDLARTGVVGKPRMGFPVDELVEALGRYIGWVNPRNVVLLGAGNLGSALLNFPWMQEFGLRFVAAFDKQVTSPRVNRIPVLSLHAFPRWIKNHPGVQIAVVAVPPDSAQGVADLLVASGIKGIWNFSNTHLRVPPDVIVENTLFTESLAMLTRRLLEQSGA